MASQQQCYVFMDNSNLWIEGQKVRAKNLKDADIDPRFRIDHGGFLELVARERHIAQAKLYGSRPPDNDSVWEAARQKGFEVEIFERYPGGPEKEVDVTMGCQMVLALQNEANKSTMVFTIASGDRDFMFPIKHILQNEVHVEMWSWRDGIAQKYQELAEQNPLFTVNYLDEQQDSFGYTEHKSAHSDIKEEHAIIYKDISNKPSLDNLIGHINQLERLFYTTILEEVNVQHLVVEFPNTDLETVLNELGKLRRVKHELSSYADYLAELSRRKHRYEKETTKQPPLSTSNRFEGLPLPDLESLESFPNLASNSTAERCKRKTTPIQHKSAKRQRKKP